MNCCEEPCFVQRQLAGVDLLRGQLFASPEGERSENDVRFGLEVPADFDAFDGKAISRECLHTWDKVVKEEEREDQDSGHTLTGVRIGGIAFG